MCTQICKQFPHLYEDKLYTFNNKNKHQGPKKNNRNNKKTAEEKIK